MCLEISQTHTVCTYWLGLMNLSVCIGQLISSSQSLSRVSGPEGRCNWGILRTKAWPHPSSTIYRDENVEVEVYNCCSPRDTEAQTWSSICASRGYSPFHLCCVGGSGRQGSFMDGPRDPNANEEGLSSLGFTGVLEILKSSEQTADSQSY